MRKTILALASAWGVFVAGARADAGPAHPISAVDRSYMNLAVSPCTDFYEYANGAFDRVPIPGEYSSYGVNNEIDERTNALLKEILEDAARDPGVRGTVRQRIGDFYASGMDEARIEADGLRPLENQLGQIASLTNAHDIVLEIARLHREGVDATFNFSIGIDDKNSSVVIARITQSGLGLPERDYYFRDDAESVRLRKVYVDHIARTFMLAGQTKPEAEASAKQVMEIETKLANASRPLADLQDPEKNYHKWIRSQLHSAAPVFDWADYFSGIGFPDTQTTLIVGQPEFLTAVDELLRNQPLIAWQAYLRWQLLRQCSPMLGSVWVNEHFGFYGKTLSGVTELPPRWKRIREMVDAGVGEDLGQLYVQRAFSAEAKQRVQQMVHYNLEAMRQRIAAADWLAESTKQAAYRKIRIMRIKVGYPDKWRDYSGLQITRQSLVGNVLAADTFEFNRQMAKLGRPVDHDEWEMTPPTNNAYYEPTLNEICLPAGILQPPFFDLKADDAANYGALASTIGHELTHGFDSSGRQYDATGTLRNWWTEDDLKRFNERAESIAALYDHFEVLPGLHINGHQTIVENIADVGGLRVSYLAFKLATRGKPQPTIDGFTPDQRFFIAFAQGWRTNDRPEHIRLIVQSDTHSPARWRVIGSVTNFPEFRAAFHCTEPEDSTARIW